MAKKKAKKSPKKTENRAISPKEYLEIKIRLSKRAITGRGGEADDFFVQQAEKLEKQLKALGRAK